LGEGLAIVELGGRGDAVGAMAEEDLVEVELENLVLAQRVLDAEREEHLGQLARVALLRAQEEVAGNLLGDGRATLGLFAAREDDMQDRARGAGQVDAAVIVEVR